MFILPRHSDGTPHYSSVVSIAGNELRWIIPRFGPNSNPVHVHIAYYSSVTPSIGCPTWTNQREMPFRIAAKPAPCRSRLVSLTVLLPPKR